MKGIISIVFFLITFAAKSQSIDSLLISFKNKNVNSVVQQCSLPFDLRAGSMIDDENITKVEVLKQKLQKLFNDKYFDSMLKGKRIINSEKNTVSYEARSFNKEGELESESNLTFFFKKEKNGKLRLFRIAIAG